MKTRNKLLVFCVLLMFMFCLSVVHASEINDNTTNIIDDNIQSTDNQEQYTKELINTEDITEKDVSKKESTENVKTAKQVTVNSYQQLLEEVENAKKGTEKTYTINLKPGNYDVNNIILWDNNTGTAKKLIINGNNNIISGKNNYAFINVTSGNKLELNNITLKNFKTAIHSWTGGSVTLYNTIITNNTGEDGGAIFLSNAKVTLYNTTLTNNTANKSSGAIYSYNRSTVTVYNSTLSNNKANNNAGAIYSYDSSTLTLYNATLTNNTAIWEGGAIYSNGNATLYNTTLSNNIGEAGGAIYLEFCNVTIYNTIINNNTANEYGFGGAIYSSGNVTLYNSTINNNKAKEYGGAIYSSGNVTLYNTTLTNNTAKDGGAITSLQKKVSVYNSTLTYNTASEDGGAIYSYDTNLTVHATTLTNNTAKYGGAIHSYSYFRKNVTVYNSTLTNNTASEDGGAIYSYNNNFTINNTTLSNNKANENGGAIFSNDSNLLCSNIDMLSNHAGYRGGAIYYKNNDTLNYSDIKFLNNSAIEGKNIYVDSAQTRIELNNSFGVYRDKISITGKLINVNNSNIGISYEYITYNIDGIKGRTSTDYYGVFNISIKLNETGTKKVYVEYEGNDFYLPSNITKTLTVSKRNTTIEVDEIAKSVGSVTVKGRLTDPTNSKLINANIYVTLNGEKQHLLSDMNGRFTTNFTVTKTGTNELSIIYNGNKNYEGTSYTTTLNLISEKEANITFFNIEPTTYHNYTKINGKLTDKNGNTYENTVVSIIVNNETVDAKTNSKGQFTINYLTKKAGTNNVTTAYQKTETPLKTFTVIKRTTKILVNQTKDTKQKQTVTITGQLLDQCDVKLRNANIYIKINTQTYHVTTNNDGIYTLDYTTETKGLNNITVTYKGNSNYEKTTQKTTFQVN